MFDSIYRKVREANLTYLGGDKLDSLRKCIGQVKAQGIEGNFLEFGLALGGSGICIASELDGGRAFYGLDVFGMIPPPSERDGAAPQERYRIIKSGASSGIGGDQYYGYVDDLKTVVIENFRKFGLVVDGRGINLVQGLYQDTIGTLPEMKIAFCHIDCDWYDPVTLCLDYVAPRLSAGGFVILDDYNDWPGCRQATDDFLTRQAGLKMIRTTPHAVLTKLA